MNHYELAIEDTLKKLLIELGVDDILTKLGVETYPMTATEAEFDRIIERDRARDVDELCEPEPIEYPEPELVESDDDDD